MIEDDPCIAEDVDKWVKTIESLTLDYITEHSQFYPKGEGDVVLYVGYNTFSDFASYYTSAGRLDIFVRGNSSLDAEYDELLVDKVDSSLLEYYIRTVML